MRSLSNIDEVIHARLPAVPAGQLDAIGDFAINVGGVQKDDLVLEINACEAVLTQKLRRLGARVVMVENWAALSRPSLPMASSQADMVFAHMVLHHMQFPALTIAEIKRVLRPGGRLVITDMGKYNDPRLRAQRNDRWMGFYASDIRHWLKKVGFSNIIVNPVPCQLLGADAKNPDFNRDRDLIMATATA